MMLKKELNDKYSTYNKKKIYYRKKFLGVVVIGFFCMFLPILAGCRKKAVDIPVFTYQINEDDTITLTGLTDKGRSDDNIVVPAQIEDKKVSIIDNEVFRNDQNVHKITIEEGIEKIGDNVFMNCGNLEELNIPSSVIEIGTNVVKNSLWEKNALNENDTVVLNHILVGISEEKEDYNIPDGVEIIAPGVFYTNDTVISVKCPDSLRKISQFAFSDCKNLESVELSNGLDTIEYRAFSGCNNLMVQIPQSVSIIENEAFRDVKLITQTNDRKGSPWGAQKAE